MSTSASLSHRVTNRELDRARLLAKVRGREVTLSSVCDATPPLIGSAEVLGEPEERPCPVCHHRTLRLTRWIHSIWLGEKSGTARNVREIQKVLEDFSADHADGRPGELSIHTVEVCLRCKWNFLIRYEDFIAG
ncbi:hypothetical protein GSS87_08845 [Corynebacterium sp. 4HC-13]|nr:DUF5318 family protein [Corynebacterium anserum]MBC2682492.1 hypothetical protein [Corynebacterium anserum]